MIALLTDFGPDNHYVAQMKARILVEDSSATLVDITHSITPQNIGEAAFVLRDSIEAFPAGAIFVVVVDPGVGTDRKILIVECNHQVFVLPDNGLIDIVARRFGIQRAYSVEASGFPASNTFHGRDIMAPIAGRIHRGLEIASLAALIDDNQLIRLDLRDPVHSTKQNGIETLSGQIVYADRFGNLISNLESDRLPAERTNCKVRLKDNTINGIQSTFSDGSSGELIALIGSHDRLEIAVNCGSAKQVLGDWSFPVVVEWT